MTRRGLLILTALLGVAGVVFALASPASAQVGLPPLFDLAAFLTNLFQRLAPILSFLGIDPGFLRELFAGILESITGSCAPFCAS